MAAPGLSWASQVVLVVKNLPASARDIRDASSIPGLGKSYGRGHGNPFQYSFLENPVRGACNFLGSVSSQQKFEAMDIKALSASQSVLQLHVTVQSYLENKRKIHPQSMRAC